MRDSDPTPRATLYEVSQGLLLKRWGDSPAVVFHPASNSTHLVDACAGSMLVTLIQQPRSPIDADAADPKAQQREETLLALLQAGMVRPIQD